MSDGLTFDMLAAAIAKMDGPGRPSIPLDSIPFLAACLEVAFRKGVAEGSIKADDRAAWANARIEEIIGNSRWETAAKSDRVQGGAAK